MAESDESSREEEERLKALLRQVGEEAGIPQHEMEKRYHEFLSRVPVARISEKEMNRIVREFRKALKIKPSPKRNSLRVTVTLTGSEIDLFDRTRNEYAVKSNSAVFRRLLLEHAHNRAH
jgi:hypothetical protein